MQRPRLLAFSALVAIALATTAQDPALRSTLSPGHGTAAASGLVRRASDHLVLEDSCDVSELDRYNNSEICQFIETHCSTALFSLSHHYYCTTSQAARTSILIASALALLVFFLTFALLTQHFLYPNLSLLARYLHISPKIAGLTLLALGNATPDVFSTYSAMAHDSASLALGELVGAANFVICVVVGGMGILRPFSVDKDRFCWDLAIFGGLVCLAFWFISDGKLRSWECLVMIWGYMVYVTYQVFSSDGLDEEHIMEEGLLHGDVDSIKSLDENQMRGLQPVGLIDAQRIWATHKEHHLSPLTPLLGRPSLQRAFKSTEQLRYADERRETLVKSASTDQVNLLESMRPLTFDFISAIADTSETTDTTTEEVLTPREGPWWVHLISPFSIDEPKTTFTFISAPIVLILNILNPVFPEHLHKYPIHHSSEISFKKRLFRLQLLLLPLFFNYTLATTPSPVYPPVISLILLMTSSCLPIDYTIPTTGFISSILLIILTSSHLISLLKNLGVVLRIPESLLGLTVLAIGNSTGDLVSNLTLASLDMGVVGLNACFGAPLLYILFGIGVNGLLINILNGKSKLRLVMDDNFIVSGVGLMVMLVFYAIVVPYKGWKIDQSIGIVGVVWWCIITAVNVYVSM